MDSVQLLEQVFARRRVRELIARHEAVVRDARVLEDLGTPPIDTEEETVRLYHLRRLEAALDRLLARPCEATLAAVNEANERVVRLFEQ